MRRPTTLIAAGLLALVVAACQLLPFAPSEPGADGQSPGPVQSPAGDHTFGQTTGPGESVPASISVGIESRDPAPSPTIEIPPPID